MQRLQVIPLAEIRENPVALRTVNKQSEAYQGLVASIARTGVISPISVRPQIDPESQVQYFEIIDGLHRYSASKDANKEDIPAHIISLDQDQLLEAQIMANFHSIETKPVEYSKQLRRILSRNPMMTESDLAGRLGVSPTFIQQRLGITRIDNPKILALIDEGKIQLSNAFALAKLPNEEMAEWVDRAMTQGFNEFGPAVQNRVKELRDAKRAGKDPASSEFQAVAHMRKLSEIKEAIDAPAELNTLVAGASSVEEAALITLNWVINLDSNSIATQKAAWEQRQKDQAEKAKQKAIKAAADKKEKAAKAQKEAEEAEAAANS